MGFKINLGSFLRALIGFIFSRVKVDPGSGDVILQDKGPSGAVDEAVKKP